MIVTMAACGIRSALCVVCDDRPTMGPHPLTGKAWPPLPGWGEGEGIW
jgi:hypothetical protein